MTAMLASDAATQDRHLRMQDLLARARAVALRSEATATRRAVAGLVAQVRALTAALHLCGWDAAVPPGPAAPDPGPVPRAPAAAGLRADGLDDLVEGLIAAHADALAWDDAEAEALLAGALIQIGRYVAIQLGGRTAGVTLS